MLRVPHVHVQMYNACGARYVGHYPFLIGLCGRTMCLLSPIEITISDFAAAVFSQAAQPLSNALFGVLTTEHHQILAKGHGLSGPRLRTHRRASDR